MKYKTKELLESGVYDTVSLIDTMIEDAVTGRIIVTAPHTEIASGTLSVSR